MAEVPTTYKEKPLAEVEAAFDQYMDRGAKHACGMLSCAWHAGRCLTEIKNRLPHGAWKDWLVVRGISQPTAWRQMKLSSVALEAVMEHATMGEALASLRLPAATQDTGKPFTVNGSGPGHDAFAQDYEGGAEAYAEDTAAFRKSFSEVEANDGEVFATALRAVQSFWQVGECLARIKVHPEIKDFAAFLDEEGVTAEQADIAIDLNKRHPYDGLARLKCVGMVQDIMGVPTVANC